MTKSDAQSHEDDRTDDSKAFDYETWNQILLDHIFQNTSRFTRVRLNFDEETLSNLGGSAACLVEVVLNEARIRGVADVQTLGLAYHDQWRHAIDQAISHGDDIPPPPFFAVLVLYVLAVNHGGIDSYRAHAYYPRLNDLLMNPPGRIDSIQPSIPMWEALEEWSTRLLGGRRGFFEIGILGKQKYVGIPRRQVLIAPCEESPIRGAFLSAGLTPGSDPTDRRIHAAVRYAEGLLSRTHRLLSGWPRDDAAQDLIEELRSRFDDWDQIDIRDSIDKECTRLPLRLVLRTRGSRIVGGYFETVSVRDVTDEECRLSDIGGDNRQDTSNPPLWLRAGDSNSSHPVLVDESGDPEWALRTSWFEPLTFQVGDSSAQISRSAVPQLVLGRADSPGILREISSNNLNPDSRYLLVRPASSLKAQTPEFVDRFLDEWQECEVARGNSVRPFVAASSCQEIRERHARIRLIGGIRAEPGQRAFIDFALPDVILVIPSNITDFEILLHSRNEYGLPVGRPTLIRDIRPRSDEDMEMSYNESAQRYFVADLPTLHQKCTYCELELIVEDQKVDWKRFYVDRVPIMDEEVDPILRDGLGLPTEVESRAATRGLNVIRGTTSPSWHSCTASRPVPETEKLPRDIAGQRLMQLMQLRKTLSWKEAKACLPACLPAASTAFSDTTNIALQVQALHSLGIVELEENPQGGLDRLVALPPQITLLPRLANRGYESGSGILKSYEAVLVGCWLPDQLLRLQKAAKPRAGVDLHVTPRKEWAVLAPHRRALLSYGESSIARFNAVAEKVGALFDESEPLACRLARATRSIDELADSHDWTPGRPSDVFTTRYFDPRAIGVSDCPIDNGDRYVLWECRHPNRPIWQHYVVDREKNCRLLVPDRQIARWFVRKRALQNTPIPAVQDEIIVPLELRLPRLLERVLVLSSGFAPVLKRYTAPTSPFMKTEHSRRFAIPAPPERQVDWLAFRKHCTGNFCCYRGAYGTAAWPWNEPMPMLGIYAEMTRGIGLEG